MWYVTLDHLPTKGLEVLKFADEREASVELLEGSHLEDAGGEMTTGTPSHPGPVALDGAHQHSQAVELSVLEVPEVFAALGSVKTFTRRFSICRTTKEKALSERDSCRELNCFAGQSTHKHRRYGRNPAIECIAIQ